MSKKSKRLKRMNLLDLLFEKELTEKAILETESIFLKRDYKKYLDKILKEIEIVKGIYGKK